MPVCQFVTFLKTTTMHNFVKSTVTTIDSLKEVKKGLKSPKKEFMAAHTALLETLFDAYDKMAATDQLHRLAAQWAVAAIDAPYDKAEKETKQHLAYSLYGSDRPFINYHWERLKSLNGGETLYCPICGLQECDEMDHYVPRDEELFPEYAVHLSNLIPLCHRCNNKKSTKFLNAAKTSRLIFNAYYDTLQSRNMFVCTISLSPLDGFPTIKISLAPSLSSVRKPDKYILSTISELELMPRFESRARLLFKKELNRLSTRAGQSWEMLKAEMIKLSSPTPNDPDVIQPAIMKAIAESEEMKAWFTALG